MHAQTTKTTVSSVATDAIRKVRDIENLIVEEEWKPPAWVAAKGPQFPSVQPVMVLMWRHWYALVNAVKDKSVRYNTVKVRDALTELAAASIKAAVDLDAIEASGGMKDSDVRKAGELLTSTNPNASDYDMDGAEEDDNPDQED